MELQARYPHTTHSREANILACELRGESHESLACLAANLSIARDFLRVALQTITLHAPSLDAVGIRELCDEALARAEALE